MYKSTSRSKLYLNYPLNSHFDSTVTYPLIVHQEATSSAHCLHTIDGEYSVSSQSANGIRDRKLVDLY